LLRITGGELGGRRFKAPKGNETRPTSDKVREALFAILSGDVRVERVADLFAGSGALGIEALSRGAGHCLFVERSGSVIKVLRENLESLDLKQRSRILPADAAVPAKKILEQGPVGLMLGDPPYDQGHVERLLNLAGQHGFLAPGGWLVLEHSPRERPHETQGLQIVDHRTYGQTELSFLIRHPD
jgi:16S rRNA (guanine966-N2)-methyltransferase